MKKKSIYIIQGIIFLFLLVYFTQIAPLQPFDGDDWRYIGSIRPPFPMWGAWNPTKVLPEVLMPIGGYIGAFIFYPITGNYLWSLSFAESLIVTIFIVAMLFLFYNLLVKRFKLSNKYALIGELLFFISCFLLFKHLNSPSYNLFWTVDLTCDFNYLIPGLLNVSVVLYMLQYEDFVKAFKNFSNLKKSLFIITIYFSIFSSIQFSIILAAFAFLKIIEDFLTGNISKFNFILVWQRLWLYLGILFLWLMGIVFESSGQRASNRSTMAKGPKSEILNSIFTQFKNLVGEMNKYVLVLSILVIILSLIVEIHFYLKKRDNDILLFLKINLGTLCCLLLSLIYLTLVYMKAGSEYAGRPDAVWPVLFLFLFSTNLSFLFLFKNIDFVKVLLPLVVVLGSILAFNFNCPPKYPDNANHDAATIRKVNEYILNQVIQADKKGKSKVIVRVPLDEANASPLSPASNWPHPYAMERYLQDTLYNHHITRIRMKIIFKPNAAVNQKLYENTQNQQPLTPIESNYF